MTIAARNAKKGMRFQWERCLREAELPWNVKSVGLLLATYGDANGREIFPGVDRIEQDCGLKRRAVLNILKVLRDTGWAVKEPHRKRRSNDTYHLVIPGAEYVHEGAPIEGDWVHPDAPIDGVAADANGCTQATRMSALTDGNDAGQSLTYHGVTTEYKELSPAGGAEDTSVSSPGATAPPPPTADADASAPASADAQAGREVGGESPEDNTSAADKPRRATNPQPPANAEIPPAPPRVSGNPEFERYAGLIEQLNIDLLADALDDFETECPRMLDWARRKTRIQLGISRSAVDGLDGAAEEAHLRRVYWWALRGFTNKEGWPATLVAPLEALAAPKSRPDAERTAYYYATDGDTKSMLGRLYEAVDRLDGVGRAQYAARFRERRPRIFAQCLEDAQEQLRRDGAAPDAIEVEALTLKYALLHYSANGQWPHWVVPPSMLPKSEGEAA